MAATVASILARNGRLLGHSLLGQSGQAAALVSLVEPRRQEVRNPTVLFNLAQALVETGRAADARTLYDALRNGAPPHILKFIEERVAAIPAG